MVAEGVSIVLLRGINVGGGNKVRMAELREALEAAGFSGARTYIQTGNIVLDAAPTPALGAAVAEALRDSFSVDVPVVVVGGPELAAMRDGLPFDGPGDKVAFAFFIAPDGAKIANIPKLLEVATDGEDAVLHPLGVMLALPNGQGRSKMADELERRLGTPVTVRNLRSVERILAMAVE